MIIIYLHNSVYNMRLYILDIYGNRIVCGLISDLIKIILFM